MRDCSAIRFAGRRTRRRKRDNTIAREGLRPRDVGAEIWEMSFRGNWQPVHKFGKFNWMNFFFCVCRRRVVSSPKAERKAQKGFSISCHSETFTIQFDMMWKFNGISKMNVIDTFFTRLLDYCCSREKIDLFRLLAVANPKATPLSWEFSFPFIQFHPMIDDFKIVSNFLFALLHHPWWKFIKLINKWQTLDVVVEIVRKKKKTKAERELVGCATTNERTELTTMIGYHGNWNSCNGCTFTFFPIRVWQSSRPIRWHFLGFLSNLSKADHPLLIALMATRIAVKCELSLVLLFACDKFIMFDRRRK